MDSVLQAGVVSAPLQVIIDKLATLTVNETGAILGVDEELRKLQRTLERIRAMVGHVQETHSLFSNGISTEAWKLWLEDVEKLCYSADDLLDGISLDLAKYTANVSRDAVPDHQVRNMLVSSLKLTVPREIRNIRKELDDIGKEMDALFMTETTKLSLNKNLKSNSVYNSYSCPRTSLVNEESVVGRERQKDEIVEMLLDEDVRGSNVSVIPIVGMGGIGKTTLAQVVYRDDRVVEKFDLRIWAHVSMDFDALRITKSIIESAMGKRCKLCDLDPIQVKLQELLKGKKFLLVLDDYWSEEFGNWDLLSSPFNSGMKGSKVVVTTRSTIVSRIVGSVPSYDLEVLSDDDCWQLMKHRAFLNKNSEESLEKSLQMEEIGRRIARKCKGLPLAAKTIASILHFEYDMVEWNSILVSEIWELPKDKNDTLPALTLSYLHLPAHLKKCFAYCSIFPKNHEFEMDELVLLWMAEGFIRPLGKVRLEDVGTDYFKNLLWRSFFQFSHINMYDQKIYKMHDLIHSVAQLVSANTCFRLEDGVSNEENEFTSIVRHFSLHDEQVQPMLSNCRPWYKNLRTFRVMSENVGALQVPYDLFLKLKHLRVLDLSRMGLDELPDSIDHLKHLRYLNLSENNIRKLPESITNLVGLQILMLERCFHLLELPIDMKNLVNLRHLYLDVKQLNQMPPGFGRLVNLQSLRGFIVGRVKGCGIEELKNMRFLRGSICITNLENIRNVNEAKEATLDMKPYLDKLELVWGDPGSGNVEEEILAGLRPHENLNELLITNYHGFMFPSWLASPRCQLSSVHLRSCQHPSILAPLAKLQHLKSLHIEDMSNLSRIDQEFLGFPSLESLTIEEAPNLTYWKGFDGGSLPCLRSLKIIDCPRLSYLPSLVKLSLLLSLHINRCPEVRSLPGDGLPGSLQSLVISESDIIKGRCRSHEGEDWNKIRVIPKIEIDYVDIHTEPGKI